MYRLIASFLGWRFIPDLLAGQLIIYLHQFYARVLGGHPPAPNTREYIKHRRYLYALVVFSYAVYTFYHAATSIGPNYYELLGVEPTADEGALKAGFRAFARKYHPDRAGPQAESLFMEVRDAYEALKDPVTRFAYDRFGATALTWTQCTTMAEYITHGLYQSIGMYVASICALLVWNKIAPRDLAFWNYILLSATFAYELLFILSPSSVAPSGTPFSSLIFSDPVSPSHSGVLGFLWPKRVAYQHISFLKSLSVLSSSALYQVMPTLVPSNPETLDPKLLAKFLTMVTSTLRNMDNEAYSMIQTELLSCQGDPAGRLQTAAEPSIPAESVMSRLDKELEDMVLESVLRSQPGPMQNAIETVLERYRKQEALSTRGAGTPPRAPLPATPSRKHSRAVERVLVDVASGGTPEGCVRGRSLSL